MLLLPCGGWKLAALSNSLLNSTYSAMQDPETSQPKGFGFCEFEEADGVMRALAHLNNLAVDGQELLLKCNAATQKYIDDYKLRKVLSMDYTQDASSFCNIAVLPQLQLMSLAFPVLCCSTSSPEDRKFPCQP